MVTAQLCRRKDELEKAGAVCYFVVPGDLYGARSFKRTSGSPYTVLSDPAGQVSALYGVAKRWYFWNGWRTFPSTFVIDRKGVITYVDINRWTPPETVLEEVRKAAR